MKTDPNVRMRMSVRTTLYALALSAVAFGLYKGLFERTITMSNATQTNTVATAYAINGEPLVQSTTPISADPNSSLCNDQTTAKVEDSSSANSINESLTNDQDSPVDSNTQEDSSVNHPSEDSATNDSLSVENESKPVDDYGFPIVAKSDDAIVKTILIDAGHGGSDQGDAASDGTIEKDVTLKLALKVKEHLQLQNPNLNVVMVREDDTTGSNTTGWEDLVWRRQVLEATQPDYFLSLHTHAKDNQAGVHFYYNANDSLIEALATVMAQNLTNQGWSSLNAMTTTDKYPLQLISMANCHALMVEVGSLKDSQDLQLMNNEESLDKAAAAIAGSLNANILENPYTSAY